MNEPYLFSIEEAAQALSIGRSKTYDLINQGKLVTITIGRRRLVRVDSVKAIVSGDLPDVA